MRPFGANLTHVALPRPRLPSPRMAAGALLAAATLAGAGMWVRDSSLVAVRDVEVRGLSGPQAGQIRSALAAATDGMTTLHVDAGQLQEAVRRYPAVESIDVGRHLPHKLVITVTERRPVGALALGTSRVAVAGDGTLLAGVPTAGLPVVPVGAPPGGRRLVEKRPLRLVALLAAAPAPLRAHVQRVSLTSHGLTARLDRGPALYFGPGSRLRAKWAAVTRVLADPYARGATYLDLRVPERPAAGGLEPAAAPGAPPPAAAPATANPQPGVQANQ